MRAANADPHAERTLTFYPTADGGLSFKGRLSADQGALVLKALERCLEEVPWADAMLV